MSYHVEGPPRLRSADRLRSHDRPRAFRADERSSPPRYQAEPRRASAAAPPQVFVDEFGRYVNARGELVDAYGRPVLVAPAVVGASTWLEGELGVRLPRPRPGAWSPPADLGPHLQLRARAGYRAMAQETAPGARQWIVSEVPAAMTRGVGDGAIDLAVKALAAAVKMISTAVQKGKERREGAAAQASPDVGCAGRTCRCGQ